MLSFICFDEIAEDYFLMHVCKVLGEIDVATGPLFNYLVSKPGLLILGCFILHLQFGHRREVHRGKSECVV